MTHPLTALALRVEQSKGPDRELDEEIAATLAGATREVQSDGRTSYYRGNCWISIGEVKNVTASIDAAMLLVPEGHFMSLIEQLGVGGPWRTIIADASRLHVLGPGAFAATCPLPISSVCLRAIAAKEEGE